MKRLMNVSMILVLLLGFLPQATANAENVTLLEQLPSGGGAAASEINSQILADDFVLIEASSIAQIEIWNQDAVPIQIFYSIYANTTVNGVNVPEQTLANGMLTPSVTAEDTAICSHTSCAYRHTLTLESTIDLEPGHYWLSVFGAPDSLFGWSYAVSNPDSPFFAVSMNNTATWMGDWPGALAFRLLETEQTCPTNIVVTNVNDSEVGSLRQAIIDICPGGTITFNSTLSGATITLSSQLTLDKDVTIDGSALVEKVSISGNNQTLVFHISPTYTVTMDSLVITGGNNSGEFVNNGGGINNQGMLTLIDSNVVANNAGIGGGIYNGGTLSVFNSSLMQNIATGGGGALSNVGTATLTGCTISENQAPVGAGVDESYGSLTVTDSTFSANIASSKGGGIYISSGGAQASIFGSTFVNNTAGDMGGGGIVNHGTASVVNSTFTGNVIDTYATGSAINNHFGTLTLYNSTLSENTGFVTLNNESGSMSLANTIIANTISGWDCSTAYGTLTESINNWVSDGDVGESCRATNFGDPMLDILADNGGPTQTMALQAGSGAIDAGYDTICSGTLVGGVDQRGITRPQGMYCDIGAFELEQTTATGSLKITKIFDPLTSGYVGTFVVRYDCSDEIWGFVDLGAGDTTTINDIPTGSQCTVSEVGIPTPPAGWSFGAPTFSPSNMVTIGETLAEVTITNTIIQDVPQTGELKISKSFDPLTSTFSGDFTIDYDCDGEIHDGTVYLAAAGSETISGIPLGTTCTVTEATLPTPPTGWNFGLPTFAPETGMVTIMEASPAFAEVTVTNTISRDTGSLIITKYFDPLTSGYTGTFAINYNRDDGETHDGTVNLYAGTSETISGIPTGTSCTITEPSLPTPPIGWSFGEPVLSPADGIVTVVIGTQGSSEIMAPAEAWVTVTNTISRDLGELKISKVFDPLASGFIGDFTITYDCDDGTANDGTVYLGAGEYETITGIPTGTTCIASEGELPADPAGWSFNGPIYAPVNGTAIISLVTSEVVVTNTIVQDVTATGELKISKAFNPLTSGFSGEFSISYNCDGTEHDGVVNLVAGDSKSITGIPIGTTCIVSEFSLPTAPEGWIFKIPTLNPASGSVTISEASPAFAEVIVTNAIVDLRSQVTTTRTKCSTFAANLAPDLERLVATTAYNRKTGETYIKKIAPSAFIYYVKVLVPAEASVITVSNITDPFGYPNLLPNTTLYDENCVPLSPSLAAISTGPGNSVRIEFPAVASERVIYIGVSYSTKPLAGFVIDQPSLGFSYTFRAALNGAIFTHDDLRVNYPIVSFSRAELP